MTRFSAGSRDRARSGTEEAAPSPALSSRGVATGMGEAAGLALACAGFAGSAGSGALRDPSFAMGRSAGGRLSAGSGRATSRIRIMISFAMLSPAGRAGTDRTPPPDILRPRMAAVYGCATHVCGTSRPHRRFLPRPGGDRMSEKRILLIEDDEDVGALLAVALEGDGYEVDVATTAAESWARLAAQAYALVIADWRLPDGDGSAIADGAPDLGAKTLIM